MRLTRPPAAIVLVLAVGAAYRLVTFIENPALPADDVALALNVASRGYAALLEPLDHGQTAPILFLWALRLAVDLGGVNELALRALPLLAGILLPLAVWQLARRLLDPSAALLAAWLTALSPDLVRFSYVVKPYGLDALVAAGLALSALTALERPGIRAWTALLIGGVVAILASTPSVFVLAGAGVALLVQPLSQRSAKRLGSAAALGVIWGAVFLVIYQRFYREVASSPYMQDFWAARFLAPAAFAPGGNGWEALARIPLEAFARARPAWIGLPFWPLAVVGVVHLGRRHGWPIALLLTAPLAAALGAATVHAYPVAQRLHLFLAPTLVVLLAAGASAAQQRWSSPRARRLWRAGVAVWLIVLGVSAARRPFRGTGMRHLARAFPERYRPGEPVYLYAGALPSWAFYATDWSAPDTARLRLTARVASPGGPAFHNSASRGGAVPAGAGDGLWMCAQGHAELVGLATGLQWREVRGFMQAGADPGWAEREAERIAAVADPHVWIVAGNIYPQTLPALLAGLGRRGGEAVETYEWSSAKLLRYRFRAPGERARQDTDPAACRRGR